MSSDNHIEPVAAIAVALVGAVLALMLDGEAETVAALVTIAVLLALVLRVQSRGQDVAEERDELDERLLELGDRDPLTGAFKRQRLDDELRRQLALAQRNRSQVAVLALDLGGFEHAVDAYGRATGDEIVLAAYEVLREELRASDFVSRPEPYSFVVVLPDADEEAARIVVGKLIRSLRGVKRAKPDGGLIDLQASIGLVLSTPSSARGSEDLLAAAHRALEAAKQAGGDRFAVDESLVLD